MRYKQLPIGEPIYFEGKYQEDPIYNLYVQMISCSFKLKPNKIPTIQIKDSYYRFIFSSNEYLESSKNKIVTLVLTNIDLKLFFENYDVEVESYKGGWKFRSLSGIFNKYIDKWIERKNKATIEENSGQRTLAKLMLNSLYR